MMRSHKSLFLLGATGAIADKSHAVLSLALWQMPSPWADWPIADGRPASIIINGQQSILRFDLRRQFTDCLRAPGLGSAGDNG